MGFLPRTLKLSTLRQHMARFGEVTECFLGGGGWAGLKEGYPWRGLVWKEGRVGRVWGGGAI